MKAFLHNLSLYVFFCCEFLTYFQKNVGQDFLTHLIYIMFLSCYTHSKFDSSFRTFPRAPAFVSLLSSMCSYGHSKSVGTAIPTFHTFIRLLSTGSFHRFGNGWGMNTFIIFLTHILNFYSVTSDMCPKDDGQPYSTIYKVVSIYSHL